MTTSVTGVTQRTSRNAASIVGVPGPQGPAGSQGFQGLQGPPGIGAPGVPGTTWYNGAIAPSSAFGNSGDYYFNTSTGDVYQFLSGSWGAPVANLTGPMGTQGPTGGLGVVQGRLTNVSGIPALSSGTAVRAATTVYFTPYLGQQIPLWNGSAFVPTAVPELSNILANTSVGNAGPTAAVATGQYDMHVSLIGGVPVLSRSAAWTSSTSRASNPLSRVQGVLVNTNSITNGPAAGFGTFVGSIACDVGSGAVSVDFGGAAAAGGSGSWFGIWNMYNRLDAMPSVQDTNATHAYTSSTPRQFGASNNNRITYLAGLAEDNVWASFFAQCTTIANGGFVLIGIGLDTNAGLTASAFGSNSASFLNATLSCNIATNSAGLHFFQAMEAGDNVNANTFSSSGAKSALIAKLRW